MTVWSAGTRQRGVDDQRTAFVKDMIGPKACIDCVQGADEYGGEIL
jgi:hypothetical protein